MNQEQILILFPHYFQLRYRLIGSRAYFIQGIYWYDKHLCHHMLCINILTMNIFASTNMGEHVRSHPFQVMVILGRHYPIGVFFVAVLVGVVEILQVRLCVKKPESHRECSI